MPTRRKPISEDALVRASAVIKCVGHPLRLRLLEIIERSGERNVSELQAESGMTQACVSEQLGILRGHGVVACRRDSKYVRYRITEPKVLHILACVRSCDTAAE